MAWTTLIAMICVAGVACYALHEGLDGAVLSAAFTVIGALAGVKIGMTVEGNKRDKADASKK